jgi:hypothetical protein
VGGLLFSQTLTLYVTPVVYVYMDRFQSWISGKGWFRPQQRSDGRPRDAAELQKTLEEVRR